MLFQNFDRVVFAGDSVTDMGSTAPVSEGLFEALGNGYVREIESLLVAWYPELNIRITNSGISGNTSRDLLGRYKTDVEELNPDWLSICIGINDVWRQFDSPQISECAVLPDEYESNLEEMIFRVKDKVKGIFIMTPFYIEPNENDLMRKRMDEYGCICKRLAEKYGCKVVDLQAVFNGFCKYQHSSRIAWDRVHPNRMGATLIAKAFLKSAGFDFNK